MPLAHLDRIQPEYRAALCFAGEALLEHFAERLQAIFLGGSIIYREALPGVSDVDWWTICRDEPEEADQAFCDELKESMPVRFPVIAEFHVNLYPVARLEQEGFWRFAFRWNGIRLYGEDILAEMEARGTTVDAPDESAARRRVGWLRKILPDLRTCRVPAYVYPTPEVPALALRKLARYFIITEGAYLLITQHAFTSFRAADVLPALRRYFPQWEALYAATAAILRDPYSVTLTGESYIQQLVPYLEWSIAFLEDEQR